MRILNLVALLILFLGGFELYFLRSVNFDTLGEVLGVGGGRIVEGIVGITALCGILLVSALRWKDPVA